ncbi:uncharacterized protein PHACADRAFT_152796 [Phanerochaete carnosa HHB-10118-sp]|uniref:Peptidase A1 domain-containing protein n=1 Tax=Phanerochaete carnosa (strain HHB-10118-sp) TaxID=650164 RepID=K5ULT2_PHACS|nr:uncharacterized protein PHACADRAFT_152796 [Phanerochaete carnosa HHB-10118-sp]EKM50641.1 hypothetical protein PHACADRAFT_152796 [Phanerochaete carnosa HHB-10118-sp]
MSPRSRWARLLPLVLAGVTTAASLHDAPLRRQPSVTPTGTTINFTNVANPFNFNVVDLAGDNQVIYVANITIDGRSYEVQLDTGSSDLWLNTQNITLSSAANDTNISTSVAYGDRTVASGDIFLAPAQLGNFSIPAQAFISAPGTNATSDNDLGLMGLSSKNLSQIYERLQNTTFGGLPVLYNIFETYSNVSNFITFQLVRSKLGITEGGVFTIGDVDPNLSAVLNQTQLPVIEALNQWVVFMDGIVVDGKKFTGHGFLPATKNKTVALVDSGTSLGEIPQYYWDAIYGDIPGVELVNAGAGIYEVPCDLKRNVSLIFNGTEYPLNPLDLSYISNVGDFSDGSNVTLCLNTFSPMDLSNQDLDFILGDAFMRNVYALFNFGNWTDSSECAPPPYIQMLSTTNQSEAWAQFDDAQNARIQQWIELQGQFNATNATNAS